jgi:hypothetical protein
MDTQQAVIVAAVRSWQQVVTRVGKHCSTLSEDQLLAEVSPGKNRLIYLWGHLTAIHDAMLPLLGLGERLHPELDSLFISNPDRSVALPSISNIGKYWEQIHTELSSHLVSLTADEWLQRHNSVSPEDFKLDPTRNRLAILLSRTNHASYHLGQMMLAHKKD